MANRTPQRILRIVAPTDLLVLQWLKRSMEQHDGDSEVRLAGHKTLTATSHEWRSGGQAAKLIEESIGRGNLTLITTAKLSIGDSKPLFERAVSEFRPGQAPILIPSLSEAEIFFDDTNAGEERFDLELRRIAGEIFVSPSPKDVAGAKYAAAIGKEVAELSALSRKITDHLNEEQRLAAKQIEAKRQELEQEFSEKAQKFEKEILAREEFLERRNDELHHREQSLQLQESKHERRDIRNNITQKIQTRLSGGQSRKARLGRLIVLAICIWGSAAGLMLAITTAINGSASQLLTDGLSVGEAIDLTKMVGGGTIAIALTFYALNFWRKKIDDDERHERLLERYSLDIDRGSWIVETVFDIRSENPDAEISGVWLEGVSGGLFPLASESSDEKDDAVDALGILLKKGAHFRLTPNGAEFELSEKAAKRVGRDAD